MANAFYPLTKDAFQAAGINVLADTIKAALVGAGYTYSAAHDFYDDIGGNVLGTPQTLASKTLASGTFDAADITFTAVPAGQTGKAIVIYKDTGSAFTSPLIVYIDTMTSLPVTTDGGNINVAWDATGIYTL